MGWLHHLSPLIPTTNPGPEFAGQGLCKIEHLYSTPECQNQLRQWFLAHPQLLVLSWSALLNVLLDLCLGMGLGWLPVTLSFKLPSLGSVLVWGQGGNVSSLTAVGGGCDPSPGIKNTRSSWGLLCFGHYSGYHLVLGYSPCLEKQYLPNLQQRSCEQRWSDPGQSNCCGSWCR